MNIFEKGTRLAVRFNTGKGNNSIEDLWTIPLSTINYMCKAYKKRLGVSADEEDYLDDEISTADELTQLKFDIALSILKTRKAENLAAKNAKNRKMEKEKLVGLLAKKQDAALADLSEEDLKAKIAELG